MILKSITPKNFGPFRTETTLHLDPEVTVLTGPNDVGKTLALRAIELFCSNASMQSHEVNRDREGEYRGTWNDDQEIICTGIFHATEAVIKEGHLPRDVRPNSKITVEKRLNSGERRITLIDTGSERVNPNSKLNSTINVLKLPLDTEVRQEIKLREMTNAEFHFLQLGFGGGFTHEKHLAMTANERSFRVREADDKLNERLRQILPVAMSLRFILHEIAGQPELLGVGLVDQHGGSTPLGSRGAGVRRILNVMGALLRLDPDAGHSIVLYDEPESSLHADAQHTLRRLLEEFAAHPNVQVVYTTHSAAMINNFRPQSIRIVERKQVKKEAVSLFVNEAFNKNFLAVRSSLGMSPADSLLYAPITIIVEGKSEVFGLPEMLKKLAHSGILDATKLANLLPLVHILDGEGSSFEYWCDLAITQRVTPIVFLDGDKQPEKRKFLKDHPAIRVVSLDDGTEIEDLIPREIYFEAMAELLGESSTKCSEQEFDAWEEAQKPKSSEMFSKSVF